MPDSAVTHMNKRCQICGDTGVTEAIASCLLCKDAHEHVYCMGKGKKCNVFPLDWRCEACESPGLLSSDSGVKKDFTKGSVSNPFGMELRDSKEAAGQNKLIRGARGNWREKEVQTGKTKYLFTQEVIKMPSGDKKGESNLRCSPLSVPHTPFKSTSTLEAKSISPTNSSYKVQKNPPFCPSISPVQSGRARPGNAQYEVVQKVNDTLLGKRHLCIFIYLCLVCLTSKRSCNFITSVESKNFDAENRTSMTVVPSIEETFYDSTAVENLPTDPAPNPSWKGIFKFKDARTSDGFQAYPPSIVLRKVYEFSKKMPEVLEFELLPRQELSMDIFRRDSLYKDDIGLYFFPQNNKRSKSYMSLLEHMSEQELVMRSYIDGVELLVLTSKVLHEVASKWTKFDFLWGVYCLVKPESTHHRRSDVKGAVEENMVVDMDIDIEEWESNAIDEEEVEMEIDMEGGKAVGRLDVVSRGSMERSCGISGSEATTILLPASNPILTTVSSKTYPSLPVKTELCSEIPPGFGASMGEVHYDIPPGFDVSRKVYHDVPPGFGAPSDKMYHDIPPGFNVPQKMENPLSMKFDPTRRNPSPVQDFCFEED